MVLVQRCKVNAEVKTGSSGVERVCQGHEVVDNVLLVGQSAICIEVHQQVLCHDTQVVQDCQTCLSKGSVASRGGSNNAIPNGQTNLQGKPSRVRQAL